MKSIGWTLRDAPPLFVSDPWCIEFYDYKENWDYEIDDRIQYNTSLGILEYKVIKVEPANQPNFPSDMRKVTAQQIIRE